MNDYCISLALTYFKEKRQDYIISELSELLGYNKIQVENLLSVLIDKNYLEYNESLLLSITGKGLTYLIAHNKAEMILKTDEIKPTYINPDTAISSEDPYVPRCFFKKY